MADRDLATDGDEDDYARARRLFFAAHAIEPDKNGRPSELSIQLLRAASVAWERHLAREGNDGSSLTMSDELRDWCMSHLQR